MLVQAPQDFDEILIILGAVDWNRKLAAAVQL